MRGIGVHNWDGTLDGTGTYEDKDQLKALFEPFGEVLAVVTRHRVDTKTGENTSWALVTMVDVAARERALASTIIAGHTPLNCNQYCGQTAKQSTGAMSAVQVLSKVTGNIALEAKEDAADNLRIPPPLGLEHTRSQEELHRTASRRRVASAICANLATTQLSSAASVDEYTSETVSAQLRALATVPIPQDELNRIADALEPVEVSAAMAIITIGEPGDALYFIEQGTAKAEIDGLTVMAYQEGDYFGEMALLTGEPRKATVRAGGEGAQLLKLCKARFDDITSQCKAMMDMLAARRKQMDTQDAHRMQERTRFVGLSGDPSFGSPIHLDDTSGRYPRTHPAQQVMYLKEPPPLGPRSSRVLTPPRWRRQKQERDHRRGGGGTGFDGLDKP